eukprot:TRINITY_DN4671_c0_g1_i1.p1 TRINITY_DN4671_c0_g1~~TRINITY_DN4671_c0_g1_i1.p1  ORF type:complete len:1492 (-),score=328.12 TRINITY_DN4671_c0_g1_i1:22-4221(-)
MQSYSNFSVGGSVSLNVHGVTTDDCLAESIESIRLVNCNGEVVDCSLFSEVEEERELFRLAVGGLGLFGVITEICMKVSDNTQLDMVSLLLPSKEFLNYYDSVLENDDVEVKLARLDLNDLSQIDLFLFSRTNPGRTVSVLPTLGPRKMSGVSQLLYKWLAPTIKEIRFALEHKLGVALDWNNEITQQRNLLMFESAEPLARLFEPIFRADDTFVLQEYFVPRDNFNQWIDIVKPIIQKLNDSASDQSICSLLNITIRYVKKDTYSFLPYSRCDNGSFAFVLYFRIQRTEEGDQYLQKVHNELVEGTLTAGGVFYLPYRKHYDYEQLVRAYPNIEDFWEKKQQYDPECVFDNLWHQHYSKFYRDRKEIVPLVDLPLINRKYDNFELEIVSERREDSFSKVIKNARGRDHLLNGFLEVIFNVKDANSLFRTIAKVCWDVRNKNDRDIYCALQEELKNTNGPLATAMETWKQIGQLRDQRLEILRETKGILGRLGKIGYLKDYISIGDNGKMVEVFKSDLHITGNITIVHDEHSNDIPAVLERCSLEEVGEFKYISYDNPVNMGHIEGESADIITMNQGLHHLPQNHLMQFVENIYRILRPGGIFIVREHDLDLERHPQLLPMLDVAHMVFNAVTGVSFNMERLERRGFRSVLEWRDIISSVGFVDTMLYDMQDGDPTWDEMLCFYKPPLWDLDLLNNPKLDEEEEVKTLKKNDNGFNQVPVLLLDGMKRLIMSMETFLKSLSQTLHEQTGNLSIGQAFVLNNILDQFIQPSLVFLSRFVPLLDNISFQDEVPSFIPPELGLLFKAIVQKVENGEASPMEMMVASFIKDVENAFNLAPTKKEPSPDIDEDKEEYFEAHEYEVSEEEVLPVLVQLFDSLPRLSDPVICDEFGVGWNATKNLKLFQDSLNLEDQNYREIAFKISENIDRQCWEKLETHLLEASSQGIYPTMELCTNEGNPWYDASLAILASPLIELPASFAWKASLIGLQDFVTLYKTAKSQNIERKISNEHDDSITQSLAELARGPIRTVTMTENNFRDIYDVYKVIEVKYGYESISKGYADVTQKFKELFHLQNSLLLKNVDVTKELHNAGVLGNVAWDNFVVGFRGKVRELIITYQSSKIPNIQEIQQKFDEVRDMLSKDGWINKDMTHNHLTWFKLPEWLQVEIVNQFGKSMDHTPWYRFPFMEYIQKYFSVLYQEVLIVKDKYGWGDALLSTSFFVDLIPGVVMAYLMLQMLALAYPLRLIGGDEYDTGSLVEKITLYFPKSTSSRNLKTVHRKIVQVRSVSQDIFQLEVPTFKHFTEVLQSLSEKLPDAMIMDISGNTEIQVRVKFVKDSDEESAFIRNVPDGCEVKFSYDLSMDLNRKLNQLVSYSIEVKVVALLNLLRLLSKNQGRQIQVFDFYH